MSPDPDGSAGGGGAIGASGRAHAPESPRKPASSESSPRKGFLRRHRRAAMTVLVAILAFGFVYYVLPQIAGLGATLERLRHGNLLWLGLGLPFEALSMAAYILLFRAVFSGPDARIGWWVSYQITMAGGGATKFFAAAGSGGVALTVWALRASGMSGQTVARKMVCFQILNYGVYMAALVIAGFGLWSGLLVGGGPAALTLVPALFGLGVIVVVLSMKWLAAPAESHLRARAQRSRGRAAGRWARAARYPKALQDGLSSAIAIVRSGDRSWLAAIPAWGFDIATLWASFHAFGHAPPVAVIVICYYVGTFANALPLPGGIGGVEGGMIGCFVAFHVAASLAVLAVLAYRTLSYWLPVLPEGGAYLHLRSTVGDWRKHPSQGSSELAQGSGVSKTRGARA